jgi:hypothetical protein
MQVEYLDIEGQKKRYAISPDKSEHVKYVKQVVFVDRKDYWPLSVRQVHYPLLNYDFLRNIKQKLRYANDTKSYKATSDLITRLRLNGEIPWEAFDDVTRPFQHFPAFDDKAEFVRLENERLYDGYWRNLLQSQPDYVEVVCEKNTIYGMGLRVTQKYQIPTSSGRGFNSIDPWHDLAERYLASDKDGLIVIVLSDYDPEGEMIPLVAGRTLRDDFGLEPKVIKAGVTREQVAKYDLPAMNFAKESSSNRKWFKERNGGDETVWELEALNPEDMMNDMEEVIQSVIDIDLFNQEVETEAEERRQIAALRTTAGERLRGLLE